MDASKEWNESNKYEHVKLKRSQTTIGPGIPALAEATSYLEELSKVLDRIHSLPWYLRSITVKLEEPRTEPGHFARFTV